MNSEDAREYQIALERRRRQRTELGRIVSVEDELEDADEGVNHYADGLFRAWMERWNMVWRTG